MKSAENLTLYYKPTCPYCIKVLAFIENNGLTIDVLNTQLESNRSTLVEIGGKQQVPCLIIDGKALYESSDIIEFLRSSID